nr:hypothetical protein [Tanacetum cinerariifolium]
MNTASTSGSRPLPSNTIVNPKGELESITTRSGLVLDGPSIPMLPSFINPEEDERVEETLTDPKLGEFSIKVPPPLLQKPKPPSQRNYMLHINITLADALIRIPKYHKMLKSLLSNNEKLLEIANTPFNENCSAVILKKLPKKLKDPMKFLIPCGFSVLKCKALADLGASINLMPLCVWKKLGLCELISTHMTLELANRAIGTPAGIARDVFVLVGKFIFPADFVIFDYESDPIVPLILGRPFLRTARALSDVHGEEMIIHDVDERLTLNTRHYTLSYSNQPQKESINMINIHDDSCEDFLEDLFATNHLSGNPTFSSHSDLTSPKVKHDIFDLEFNTIDVYNDPFDSKGEKIKESKLLIDELDLPRSSDFLPSPEYDSFLFEDFSDVDALPSTNNEGKVFNPGILIDENLSKVTTPVAPDKNVNKIAISHASLILEDFDPPLYELHFHKEDPWSKTLLSFSSENEEKVFNPKILTSKEVHSYLLLKLSHRGPKVFKVIKIFESPMEILPCSHGEDIRILDVPCLHFYPP